MRCMHVGSLVLLHSPLTTAAAWGDLAGTLRERGQAVVVPDITDDDRAPYAQRYVARACLAIGAAPEVTVAPTAPVTLIAHSGAGPLLPAIGRAQRAAHRRVAGYVFCDAGLPPVGPLPRRKLLPPELAAELDRLFEAGGTFPDWAPPPGLSDAIRPRGRDFFHEPLPMPQDWPDAPCGYLRTSAAYERDAHQATLRGWPVTERDGGHFAAHADPRGTADALLELLAAM